MGRGVMAESLLALFTGVSPSENLQLLERTSLSPSAQGIMLVYDITNEKSFDNIRNWIRNIEEVKLVGLIHARELPICPFFSPYPRAP